MPRPAAVPPNPAVSVWDPAVRVLHWTLVAAVATAWALSERDAALHEVAGWVALGAAALRLAWGAVGSRTARFARFVRGPRATWRYLGQVLARREPRHLGHNPLGAWMIVALLGTVGALGLTGWLFTTERFWGDARLGALHEALAWTLAGLAALHVAGVVFTSLRQRENLVAAMWHGTKRAASGDDVA